MKRIYTAAVFLGLWACNNPANDSEEKVEKENETTAEVSREWRGEIMLNDSTPMPFNFLWEYTSGAYEMTILNGEERISTADIVQEGDSLRIGVPVFSNYFVVKLSGEQMQGYYINPDAENYRLPFRAEGGVKERFTVNEPNCCDINEKWAVKFHMGTDKEYPAIAYFKQNGEKVTGTFMTETGDYRYLEGVLSGNELKLSAFDGAHLIYFEAKLESGQKMDGLYYSGRSYQAPWIAYRDDNFTLRNPDELTYIKKGAGPLTFSFPDLSGNTISLADERFKDKPVIVQIMGSWCPNCMDESRYLKQLHEKYHGQGLEIVGLTFERARDEQSGRERAMKMKNDLQLPYPVLMAGYTRQDQPSAALPQLNHVMSYPTTIYLNRQHQVVHIHTGFNGPGTPVYDKFVTQNKALVEKLLSPGQKAKNS